MVRLWCDHIRSSEDVGAPISACKRRDVLFRGALASLNTKSDSLLLPFISSNKNFPLFHKSSKYFSLRQLRSVFMRRSALLLAVITSMSFPYRYLPKLFVFNNIIFRRVKATTKSKSQMALIRARLSVHPLVLVIRRRALTIF